MNMKIAAFYGNLTKFGSPEF